MTKKIQPRLLNLCLSCNAPLFVCAYRQILDGDRVTEWKAGYICHNRDCPLAGKAFPQSTYQASARKALAGSSSDGD